MADDSQPDPSIERAERAATIPTPDPIHSRHVAFLSVQLFDQLRAAPGFDLALEDAARDLLVSAALWHDVGHRRSPREHHRVSFDLIYAEELRGFSPEEKTMVAAIARYHRQGRPSFEHAGYRDLTRAQRAVVDRDAALLRLAEALDASHLQLIRGVRCSEVGEAVRVELQADSYPTLEIEGVRARAALFREVFRRDVAFEWARTPRSD
jgi:exopolyphosphatase/guanosine-5'-triphosphate,3'-diphosphate pyrophosphatase